MIYTIRLVTGDEIVCEAEGNLDFTSKEIVVQNPMEIISSDEGSMYLRSPLMLSDDDYLTIPTNKIVYTYLPSKALTRYYYWATKMYDDQVKPVVNKSVMKSADTIEQAYEVDEEETNEAMKALRGLLSKYNRKDLN